MVWQPAPTQPGNSGIARKQGKSKCSSVEAQVAQVETISKLGGAKTGRLLGHSVCAKHAGEHRQKSVANIFGKVTSIWTRQCDTAFRWRRRTKLSGCQITVASFDLGDARLVLPSMVGKPK